MPRDIKTDFSYLPRGGSRYAEECWGFPFLQIKEFLRFIKFPLHVSDRYWSRIQDFQDFIKQLFIISVTVLSTNIKKWHFSYEIIWISPKGSQTRDWAIWSWPTDLSRGSQPWLPDVSQMAPSLLMSRHVICGPSQEISAGDLSQASSAKQRKQGTLTKRCQTEDFS